MMCVRATCTAHVCMMFSTTQMQYSFTNALMQQHHGHRCGDNTLDMLAGHHAWGRTACTSSPDISGVRGLLSCRGWLRSRLCLSCTSTACPLPGCWSSIFAWIKNLHSCILFGCASRHDSSHASSNAPATERMMVFMIDA